MFLRRHLWLLLLSVWLQTGTAYGQPVLEVRVKDHRDAIGDFVRLMLSIEQLRVSPRSGIRLWRQEWRDLSPVRESLDLTQYVGRRSAAIFRGEVAAGAYDGVHLKVKTVTGVLKNGRPVPVKSLLGPVKLAFEARDKSETVVILDLTVLDMSDHPPRGYELGLKGYEVYTNGKLVDRIPPA